MSSKRIPEELYPDLTDEQIQLNIDVLREELTQPQITMKKYYALQNLLELQEKRAERKTT